MPRSYRHLRRRAPRRQVLKWQAGVFGVGLVGLLLADATGMIANRAGNPQEVSMVSMEVASTIEQNIPEDANGAHGHLRARRAASEDFLVQDPFSEDDKSNGAIVVHFMIMCYMFIALAIVCDVFFEGALEAICRTLDISEDVAGASFMAAGGSAPELFTSIIGTFVTKSDIGFGTIVGSAVFNVLFVIGVCGLFAGMVLQLSWYPLSRDSTYYTISLIVLVLFVEDSKIEWWEAVILFGLYLGYLYVMKRNEDLKAWAMGVAAKYNFAPDGAMDSVEQQQRRPSNASEKSAVKDAVTTFSYSGTGGTGATSAQDADGQSEDAISTQEAAEQGAVAVKPQPKPPAADGAATSAATKAAAAAVAPVDGSKVGWADGDDKKDGDDDEEEDEDFLVWPDDRLGQVWYCILAPLKYFMLWTIPNCEEKPHLYLVSFFMSIFHIALYSYFMVWMADSIGVTLGIPVPVMGVTILAAGTSIPDALSSLAVAKRGFGDMAVSSSIGSNVFDITVGLPVPWMLWCLFSSLDDDPTNDQINIESETLWLSVSTLLLMLFVTVLSIHLGHWKLSAKLSIILIVLYFVFVAEALLLEYEVIKV